MAAAPRPRPRPPRAVPERAFSAIPTRRCTYRSATDPSDTTQWSLDLRQNGDRLEGGLIRIYCINGTSSVSVSAVKKGSVSGQNVSLEFDRGEGAKVGTTFSGTVSDDGRTMLGYRSRYPEPVTLTRR